MESSSSFRWRFMNPIEWIKIVYGWLGADHPKVSLIVVTVLGAFAAFSLWKFAGYVYAKDHPTPAPVPTIVNTTTGPGSPILPNNKGTVTISTDNHAPEQPPPKDKPK